MNQKRIRIPTEDVKLQLEEIAVTQTRQFQRLFNLKQLGLAYLVYPAATHTRGVHSIQCLNEAEKILRALDTSDRDNRHIRMAALLHDIGHVPFSHTLEDEHLVLNKHDRQERLATALDLLKRELAPGLHALVDAAMPILLAISKAPGSPQDWRSDVVGNTVCADLLAYISADAMWTGIEKKPGYYRIYEYFVQSHDRLCIKLTKGGLRTDIVSAIMDLLDMRYALTERVIFHHAKCIASAMLARGARLCRLTETGEVMESLLRMGDERFLDYLEGMATARKVAGALDLISGLRSRRLHQRIFRIGPKSRDAWDEGRGAGTFCTKWRDAQQVEELLISVEAIHNLPSGTLALWCPELEAGMKLARTHVVWDYADRLHEPVELRNDEVARQFPGVHKRVKTIEEQYYDLWTFWITLDRRYIERAAGIVRTLEAKIGIDCDPVFVETYLHQLPGYKQGVQRGAAVADVFRDLQPDVELTLAGQSGLDGSTRLDPSTVLAATKAVAEKRIKPPQRASVSSQENLFPTEPESSTEGQRNLTDE